MAFSYHYHLPESLIARQPASPRDASRLFVYDPATDTIALDRFANLGRHLPDRALLVMNDTRVIPARAMLTKEATGGKVEILFLVNEWKGSGPVPAIADRRIRVGAELRLGHDARFTVVAQDANLFFLQPHFPAGRLFAALQRHGVTPIPKYIKGAGLKESELRKKYQTVFAATDGSRNDGGHPASVAAPTASLHFTNRLLRRLEAQGMRRTSVTLDVGLGTFAPLREENIAQGTLHTELLRVPEASAQAIRKCKQGERAPVVAVGTTVVRTLESEAEKIMDTRWCGPIADATQIFIRPPYQFRIVDAMITNFHLPETSLMMLVQAFLAYRQAPRTLVELYAIAIREKFRFYSFGDAMLIR